MLGLSLYNVPCALTVHRNSLCIAVDTYSSNLIVLLSLKFEDKIRKS